MFKIGPLQPNPKHARKLGLSNFCCCQQTPRQVSSPSLIPATGKILAQHRTTQTNQALQQNSLTLHSTEIKSSLLSNQPSRFLLAIGVFHALSPSSSHPSVLNPPVTNQSLALSCLVELIGSHFCSRKPTDAKRSAPSTIATALTHGLLANHSHACCDFRHKKLSASKPLKALIQKVQHPP